ncbi:TrkH family potassium uptake protein [Methanotorris igneus]|uniref:Cation transporter n=1 Tax=Methanotorris igneus (strain DSM 5666 / JCM 11834 / Kol 5) TaxID=880724 RepID=F6BCY4_METIK|nr:TrkH family potassium uptake protein [Methanotorris igneus]AEF96345.1 cation transporter [Methanotorris igneus Kol 5]
MKLFKREDIIGIVHELGYLMMIVGFLMIVPIFVGIYYNENYENFIFSAAFSIFVGALLRGLTKPIEIKLKHAMVISAVTWLMASLLGALPFYFGIDYFSYVDAVFESMSAWTTTGFSLINNVEAMPHTILFWRSLEQWIGGVGVLVMMIGILMRSGTAAALFYKAEAREEKILPSTVNTVKTIWWIYLLYTILGICGLYLSGLSLWEAVNLTMCGICTGGMSVNNLSFPYNTMAKVIMILIMVIGGVISFSIHHKILTGKSFRDIQTDFAVKIFIVASIIVAISSNTDIIDALFTVVSAMTSTGYTTIDIKGLDNLSIAILIFLMAIGGGAGTTTGGIKIIRFLVMVKTFYYELKEIFFPPSAVIHEKLGNVVLDYKVIRESFVIGFVFVMHYIFTAMVFIALGYDPYKSIFEAVSLTSNIGMSMGIVNINMPLIGKIVGILAMWIGRLEILPIYVFVLLPIVNKIKKLK